MFNANMNLIKCKQHQIVIFKVGLNHRSIVIELEILKGFTYHMEENLKLNYDYISFTSTLHSYFRAYSKEYDLVNLDAC